ncbi:fam-a protein [Plasmodium chabaudi chabaudi]|uniref:Fam-a protein n=1 Tax=Plasmodium chabaudi chabaudi TaxID=31271 RepID=A0A4V0K4L7_PLACU|nr:fam-a protein [Plasmodium chabaudi chabaudi]VTZ67880.1 fam-a protein [Plasmodium chabaudi chabaudi]|eukprot:XP_016653509.1 fam-a protein [Plasmodium chabaudi chabaudi]
MNTFYIQISLFLLCISLYLNNKTLATDRAPGKDATPELTDHCLISEEIYEKNKHLLCTNPEEIVEASELMKEAVAQFNYFTTSKDNYKFCGSCYLCHPFFCEKKHQDYTYVKKNEYTIDDPDMYNEIIKMLWDPEYANLINKGSIIRKITRVYNKNLVMIQQRYKDSSSDNWKYFYALATIADVRKPFLFYFVINRISHIVTRNLFKYTFIDFAGIRRHNYSENDIRKGKLKKTFVNIAGYHVEKKNNYVNFTYIDSVSDIQILITQSFISTIVKKYIVDCYASSYLKQIIRKALCCFFPHK